MAKPETDCLVLVNKEYRLPEGWEETIDTVHVTNSLGDDVEVETGAYAACLRLKADLAQEGVRINLDSACRKETYTTERRMTDGNIRFFSESI